VCRQILTENLNIRCIAAMFASSTLDRWSKQQQWEKANKTPTFTSTSRIITDDGSWVYCYDPETKLQVLQWKSPQ
jgi:hypothetical protein